MLRFLGSDDTWRTLRLISRNRKCPLHVAVPYLGNGGGKLLHLARGDVLVVALTEANSRNGSVCPAEIQRLQADGVQVFLHPRLHAKVILCGNKAVVGSANLSQSSLTHLDEAAILTTDASVVKHVRAWFRQRMLESVTPEWLGICASVYRPPRGGFGRNGTKAARPNEESLWLLSLKPLDYPEDENAVVESGKSQAKRELSDPTRFKVDTIRLTGNPAVRKGDKVIQIMQTPDSRYVEELAKLIEVRRTKSRRGGAVAYLFLECRNRPKRIAWDKFKRGCAAYGLKLPQNIVTRRIASAAQAEKMMALVLPKNS
jgi:PLD-like domain